MNAAQTIIEKLKSKGMSYAAIGAAIGSSRESVSRIAHGQQSGERSLAQLQKLATVASISTITRYVPTSKPSQPRKPDIPPLTQEELAEQEEWDKYEQWEQFAPVAKTIGQAVGGIRGKIVESVLPDNYSIVKSYKVPQRARVVKESAPRPHRPRRRRRHTTSLYSAPSWGIAIGAILSLIFSPNTQQPQDRTLALPQPQAQTPVVTPRYQPTYQFPPHGAPDNQYVTLAWARNNAPHINQLGYMPQEVGEPIQPQVYMGKNTV